MKMKVPVAATLVSTGILVLLILTLGLLVSAQTLEKWSNKQKTSSSAKHPDVSLTNSSTGSPNTAQQNTNSTNNQSAPAQPTNPNATNTSNNPKTSSSTNSTSKPTTGPGGTASASISSFTASPASIAYNAASTLSWSSSNATSCSIGPGLGAVSTSGTKSTGSLTSSKTYTLTCGSATKTTTVNVGAKPPSCGDLGAPCTQTEVAVHNKQSDCWVMYSGNYYIVTSYVNIHPGGRSVFNTSTCGHDITNYLNGSASSSGQSKRHDNFAYGVLDSYKIGPVKG